jgi:glutaminyl-tRNA synthetase
MRDGKHPDGSHVLRAKIDMKSPNINMRDPSIYRIQHAEHHRTGASGACTRCTPTRTRSRMRSRTSRIRLCTLEFEDQRPFYDWVLEKIASFGLLQRPLPQQIEFSRLNLTYTVMSKRFLKQLVTRSTSTAGTIRDAHARRRARARLHARGIRLLVDRVGVSKSDSFIDYSLMEDCQREVLNEIAPRRIAVLDPLKLVIDNWPQGHVRSASRPTIRRSRTGATPDPDDGELWIEREDFMETPPKGYFRCSRATRCAQVWIRRALHRLLEGLRRQGERGALRLPAGDEVGTPAPTRSRPRA